MSRKLKTAIVHDWLVNPGGAENVLKRMITAFPECDLFAVCDFLPEEKRETIHHKPVKTTIIQSLPGARKHYRRYLPLMPLAIEQLDLSDYDLIISSSHAVAKGVISSPDQIHVCMCYSPIRYAWDMMHQYLAESNLTKGTRSWLARYLLHRIRIWDYRTATGVDHFIAISNYIAKRIEKCYGRASTVIYPPVDTEKYALGGSRSDYYLTASRLVPYKRIDLIVDVFRDMPDKRLIVIGDGPELDKIRSKAGSNVEIMGHQPDSILREKMQNARAFLFAACEDFGIVPLEAQACGTPVIAYGRGGARETVIDGVSGMFFTEQNTDAIVEAVRNFENRESQFSPKLIREHALNFSNGRFDREFRAFMDPILEGRTNKRKFAGKLHLRNRLQEKITDGISLHGEEAEIVESMDQKEASVL